MFGNFLHHFVAYRVIMLNSVERFRENWTKLMVFCCVSCRKMCGFGTQGQEASSSYLYKSAVINSGGSQNHSCLRNWMLGTIAPKLLMLGVLEFLSIQISMGFPVAGKRWYSQVAYNHRIGSIWTDLPGPCKDLYSQPPFSSTRENLDRVEMFVMSFQRYPSRHQRCVALRCLVFLNVPRTARSLSLAALRLFLLWIFFPPPCPIRRAVVIT